MQIQEIERAKNVPQLANIARIEISAMHNPILLYVPYNTGMSNLKSANTKISELAESYLAHFNLEFIATMPYLMRIFEICDGGRKYVECRQAFLREVFQPQGHSRNSPIKKVFTLENSHKSSGVRWLLEFIKKSQHTKMVQPFSITCEMLHEALPQIKAS